MKTQPSKDADRINRAGSSGLVIALSWAVSLLTVIAIVMTAVRLMIFPAFLTFEYSTPGFPDDLYGFTKEDRLYWANQSLEYLLNDAGVEFVEELRFPDGSPVFNERELMHFVDVKIVLTRALNVWLAALILLVVLGFLGRSRRLGGSLPCWPAPRRLADRDRNRRNHPASLRLVLMCSLLPFTMSFLLPEPGCSIGAIPSSVCSQQRFWRDIFIYVGLISVGCRDC